jgi:hypothetical protein
LVDGTVVGGDIFTIVAEKQPGHPEFRADTTRTLPTIRDVDGDGDLEEITAEVINFFLTP